MGPPTPGTAMGSLSPLHGSPTARAPSPRAQEIHMSGALQQHKGGSLSSRWEFAAERSAGTKGFQSTSPAGRAPPGVPASCHSSSRPQGRSGEQTPSAGFWERGQSIPGTGRAPAASGLPLHPAAPGPTAGGREQPPGSATTARGVPAGLQGSPPPPRCARGMGAPQRGTRDVPVPQGSAGPPAWR